VQKALDAVRVSGLMSYEPNFPSLYRRAGDFVDKILRGAKPADIPVEQPTKFDLVINLTTAKAIGLKIPEGFLLRADPPLPAAVPGPATIGAPRLKLRTDGH
jgi:ABC-type uncharacterized transport system substrate-binding protein